MATKIQKWGNSLAVRIPKELAKEVHLREGSAVSFSTEGESIILHSRKKPHYSLAELLRPGSKGRRRKEYDWGKTVGKELW